MPENLPKYSGVYVQPKADGRAILPSVRRAATYKSNFEDLATYTAWEALGTYTNWETIR